MTGEITRLVNLKVSPRFFFKSDHNRQTRARLLQSCCGAYENQGKDVLGEVLSRPTTD